MAEPLDFRLRIDYGQPRADEREWPVTAPAVFHIAVRTETRVDRALWRPGRPVPAVLQRVAEVSDG